MSEDLPKSPFMRLPAELRIDIYERVFEASLTTLSKKDPQKRAAMQHDMLCTLQINRTTRQESKEICMKLANRRIDELEAKLKTENAVLTEYPKVNAKILSYREFVQGLMELHASLSLDSNKADSLYGFLKMMRAPREGRAFVQRFRRMSRIYGRGW